MSTRNKVKWQLVKTVENLYKNEESGRYYVRLYYSQGGKSKSTFRSLRTGRISVAKQRIRDYLSDHEAGRANLNAVANSETTWSELSRAYITSVDSSTELKPRTKSSRLVALKRVEKYWSGFQIEGKTALG
ncbi:hypothetical protein [Cerasicoccus arenae]|uniref:Uncharacterized protein n=1 Tax=Cerasicoccus arenae TaxID=424488 RepID=A0A8J3DGL7_9BACT|nr:hypothetical protein [Cerasicoccus arenae]MBK1858125.1 hypothetical protein [Cerasicoccus arenae]GHB96640.1 hypothetical protein GCM10007047_10680 [Cerasicoccus arenae]